jgi:hypothetical protein
VTLALLHLISQLLEGQWLIQLLLEDLETTRFLL